MKQSSRFSMAFVLVLLAYVGIYLLWVSAAPKFPYEADLPTYAAALLQMENPALYPTDPAYSDGALTRLLWSSGYLYMRWFQFAHNLAQRNMSTTLALLQLLPSLLSVVTFYWFLKVFKQDKWLTLMLSVALSLWLIMIRSEGIPSVYYFACIPIFLRLLWQYLCEPSLDDEPVVLWRVTLIGMIIGISPFLLNSVNGLAFNLLTLGLVTVQFLLGKMRWRSYGALLLGVIPLLGLVALNGTGGAAIIKDVESAQYMFSFVPRGSLVAHVFLSFITHDVVHIFDDGASWLYYFPLTVLITGVGLWLWRRPTASRLTKCLFLTLSWLSWVWMIGNISILLYLYFLSRILARRETKLDYVLITAMNVGIFVGPTLTWIMIGVWKAIQWHTLIFIINQSFRFQYPTFFIASVAVLLMLQQVTGRIRDLTTRRAIQFALILLIVIQPHEYPHISVYFIILLMLTLVLLAMSYSSKEYFKTPLFSVVRWQTALGLLVFTCLSTVGIMAFAFWVTWGSAWNSGVPLNLDYIIAADRQNYAALQGARNDYLAMTEWLRLNTPVDSLIHLDQNTFDRSGFFRYLSERSLLYTWMDVFVGQYSAKLAPLGRAIAQDLNEIPLPLWGRFAADYDVNYLVMHSEHAVLLPVWDQDDGAWSVPQLVYQNPTYDIYEMTHLSTQQLLERLFARGKAS